MFALVESGGSRAICCSRWATHEELYKVAHTGVDSAQCDSLELVHDGVPR